MSDIELNELLLGLRGKPFSSLIQHHFRKQSMEQIALAIEGEKATLNPLEAKVAERIIDYFNILAYTQDFWRRDCADILEECCWLAARALEAGDPDVRLADAEYAATRLLGRFTFPDRRSHNKLFSIFQLLVLTYAYTAHEQKNFRKFAGIRRSIFRL